ncbi:formylmethanofuran dehydrogenase subunit E family protein [Desulfitobacterium metallireducens]|uniref:Formylmethanofuran dehydrogenase subunit E n=1 Tax=Desulfitobacterium metallireducens DSM 15288 TaxID=871968 RepID=W0ECH1_9FIRM|nr:formylmethanofuran dehydrogenase subunit E family protein [Desulfitobacterium metallireducens]AHF06756.1 formylmethanofuran dehydrogenase subunit E [Desulfitobacterium metallireducens DSM 15288]
MCVEKTPWEQVTDFHGHTCPGIAIGYRVAVLAQKEMGIRPTSDSELLIKAESRSCALDAFQIINKATIGRKALMIEDTHQPIYWFHFAGTQELLKISVNSALMKRLDSSHPGPLSPREKQNRNLEMIQLILTTDEEDFCSLERVPGVLTKG